MDKPVTVEPQFAEALERWERWWKRENESALPYIIFPQGDFGVLERFEKSWMPESIRARWDHWKPELMGALALERGLAEGTDQYVGDWLDYMEAYAALYGHLGGGYSFLCPGFGPACLSIFVSGFFKYVEPTVWLEADAALSFEDIAAGLRNPPKRALAYREAAFGLLERLAERLSRQYVFSMPDFGDGMDILSSLRHNMNLLTDLYDCPEAIETMLEEVGRFSKATFEAAAEILVPANGGLWASVMRYLSAEPTYLTYSDFSAMISPEHFEAFVLPMVQGHCAAFPHRTIYHLDGPGERPHVPLLCGVEELFGIQWVQGAGNPEPFDESYDSLYREMLDAGKRVSIGVSPHADFRGFFARFPAREFTLMVICADRAEGEGVLKACERASS